MPTDMAALVVAGQRRPPAVPTVAVAQAGAGPRRWLRMDVDAWVLLAPARVTPPFTTLHFIRAVRKNLTY